MTDELDEHGRREPSIDGDEWTTLTEFLDLQRSFHWKVSGLNARQLARRHPPSAMTLAGMIKHLAFVEDDWFGTCLQGRRAREPWAGIDWSTSPDWDWDSAPGQEPQELLALWQESVEQSWATAAQAFAEGGLDRQAVKPWPDGRKPSLRWITIHMIEEYARHVGHADLLREAIDGEVGE
ncbi:mini-circle protein [Microlunatus endophyticus]|uniref:Mini-circle protein n=1 Tax=Microlunatus endophyticus TaxID=1716077 RepID=A0A917W7A0_9ACTN|nr:DinB family protein [Microlunatus endophyticus]GGL78935.1 mini-circle protein [Microlunatus endophyticus]